MQNPPDAEDKTRNVNAVGERSAAIEGNVENSTIATGDRNVFGDKVDGDVVGRDKIINIQQAANAAVSALHQLRAPVGDFVGREQEIEALIEALRRGSRACISGINGMGGIGKTELALLVAQRLSADYPDAQFFINLQGTDPNPRPPHEIMGICIRGFLGPEVRLPDDLDQLSQLYRSQLSGKRALLLLDNAADDQQVLPLLPPTGCALLVTSRETITLPSITTLTLNPLTDKEARDMLLDIARHAAPVTDEICKLCGYLPLAIRAAGSLLAATPDLDPVDYVTQLKDERNRLKRIGTKGVELSVAASFNLSYARLDLEAARVFRFLSVFPATFDATAAEVVCADPDHAQLSELVRRSLVLYDTSTKRYRLHDLARLFAQTKLTEEEDACGLRRYAQHYMDVLSDAEHLFIKGGSALADGLTLFDLEWGNIQAGHAWVSAQDASVDESIAKLRMLYPNAGTYILDMRQHAREQIRWLEIAVAASQHLKDRACEGVALGNLGVAYAALGDTSRAIQIFEQRLVIAHEICDENNEGSTLGNLGLAYADLGETQRAIQFYEQHVVIAREFGDRRGEAGSLNNMGVAYRNLGQTTRAIQLHEQALLIRREIGDRRGEGSALCNLGSVYSNLGETERAVQFYDQYLSIARELGDLYGECTALWNLSLELYHLGKRDQAILYAEQSLTIHERIEDPFAPKVRAQLAAWHAENPELENNA